MGGLIYTEADGLWKHTYAGGSGQTSGAWTINVTTSYAGVYWMHDVALYTVVYGAAKFLCPSGFPTQLNFKVIFEVATYTSKTRFNYVTDN